MLLTSKEHYYTNAAEFVRAFKLKRKFKEIFNMTIEEWETTCFTSDERIIRKLLDCLPHKYLCSYDESNSGGFTIHTITN